MGRLRKAEKQARIDEARDLISQGVAVADLASRWRIDVPGARRFLLLNGLAVAARIRRRPQGSNAAKHKMYGNEPRWQNADPSALTAEQLDHAIRLNIKPSRYAWLLSCPRGGNAGGNKADRSLR